jgi:hypothetical protein
VGMPADVLCSFGKPTCSVQHIYIRSFLHPKCLSHTPPHSIQTDQNLIDMSRSRRDTLATIETPTTASFAPSNCTHQTETPIVVKRMGTIFPGGIPGLADSASEVLEFQSCFRCNPDEWTKDLHLRAGQFEPQEPPKSAGTSGSVTPTYLADEVSRPVIRDRDENVTPETLYTDAGTINDKKVASFLDMFRRKG